MPAPAPPRSRSRCAGTRIAVELVDDGDGGIAAWPGELALELLRITLELVRNSVRHAHASRVRIVVRSASAGLSATVEDDGRGLADEVLALEEGGLANLRHRIAQANGVLAIRTARDQGTRISISRQSGADLARASA